jgi:pyrimidine-nucleoside phosphorylase
MWQSLPRGREETDEYMNIVDIVSKKRDGMPLDVAEMRYVVDGFVRGDIADYQMSAFLMAVFLRGIGLAETVALTREMLASGRIFRFDAPGGPVIDKHSTGGVGDKVSLVLLPAAIECGLRVPISGRSLGFTGGTLDKLESIPGLRTDLSPDRFEEMVERFGGCFGAQTAEIVPADRKIYALRDATATIESIPLIVASILSKKSAEGISGVVIDVKCGSGAFMQSAEEGRVLGTALEEVGREMGLGVRAVLSSMEQPLGNTVGNALEVAEAVSLLQGKGPADCHELTNRLVGEMLLLGGVVDDLDDGMRRSAEAIVSERALNRFLRIIEAQGGRLDMGKPLFGLPRAPVARPGLAPRSGYIARIDPRTMGEVVRDLGGGRLKTCDEIDPRIGFVIRKKKGDPVDEGEPVFEAHAQNDITAERAVRRMMEGIMIRDEPVGAPELIL